MTVFAPLLGTLWLTLEAYGEDPRRIIDASLYRPGRAAPTNKRIRFADYDRTLARAASLIDDPAIGLLASQYLHPSHLGALGHAWLASSTLRTALRRAERFGRMYNEQVVLTVEELPNHVRATYQWNIQPTRPDLAGDSQVGGLWKLCRINLGRALTPVEVNLQRSKPQDPQHWHRIFGRNIRFSRSTNSLAISTKDADEPLTGSNTELVAVHEEVIRRHLSKLDRDNILNRARIKIMEQLPTGRVTEDGLAHALNVSKRTMHRKLSANEATFRSLLEQVRKDLARRYIRNLDYTITEIAFLLGYADASAFSRAFKNWFGLTPTQAREKALLS